jgi:hypothetical protein
MLDWLHDSRCCLLELSHGELVLGVGVVDVCHFLFTYHFYMLL